MSAPLSESTCVQRVLSAYKASSAGGARDREIKKVFSDEKVRDAVKHWLGTKDVSQSPLLQDLQRRISEPMDSPASESIFKSLYQNSMSLVQTALNAIYPTLNPIQIESMLISKDFSLLKTYFRNNPDEFIKNIDLLRTHLELKTLSINELLPILTEVAEKMVEIQTDELGGEPLHDIEYPSLLEAFSEEIKSIPSSEGKEFVQTLKILVEQDSMSSNPCLTKEFFEVLQPKFPEVTVSLLSSLSLEELLEVCPHDRSSWIASFLNNPETLKETIHLLMKKVSENGKLSNLQTLQICFLLQFTRRENSNWYIDNYYYDLECSDKFVEHGNFKECLALFEHHPIESEEFFKKTEKLESFTDAEKYSFLVYYIELYEVPLGELQLHFSEQNFLELAPYLRYVNLKDMEASLSMKILEKCSNNVTFLRIKNPEITELPALLPHCQELDCSSCYALKELPELPQCLKLNCTDCQSLERFPAALPSCLDFKCRGCPRNFQRPELPFDAVIISDEMERNLNINIEDFKTKPKNLLLRLGNSLFGGRFFPSISYFMDGKRDEAIDTGGVRRDFVTRLCENLFKKNSDTQTSDGFLELYGGVPRFDGSPNQKKSYIALGKLFALCYPDSSSFKTGPLLPDVVYKAMTASGDPQEPSEAWLVASFLRFNNAPEVALLLIDPAQKGVLEFKKDELEILSELVPSNIPLTPEYFQNPANREAFCNALLEGAKADPWLPAISNIAQGMKASLGDKVWASLCTEGSDALKERVEGKLNKEDLLKKLVWSSTMDDAQTEKTKKFLTNWINNTSLVQLQNFVRAITSNVVLTPQELKIEVFARGAGYIPTSHTCFSSLELSGEYPNQTVFDNKLDLFLAEALGKEGTGFQTR